MGLIHTKRLSKGQDPEVTGGLSCVEGFFRTEGEANLEVTLNMSRTCQFSKEMMNRGVRIRRGKGILSSLHAVPKPLPLNIQEFVFYWLLCNTALHSGLGNGHGDFSMYFGIQGTGNDFSFGGCLHNGLDCRE